MSKTLIFSPSSNIWGGGQIYIEQLCNYLNKHNKKSYIITPEPETFNCLTIKMNKVSSKKDRLKEAIKIARTYKKKGFKNIILNDLSSLWLAPVFKIYGWKVISLLHLYLETKKQNPLGHSLPEYYLLKFSAILCDEIFSVNKNNQLVFGNKVKFIGNYVPEWFFQYPKVNKKYDFILIARFAKQKNIPLFLNLLHNLNKFSNRNFNALLVGDGPERENIIQKINELNLQDVVKISGWVKRNDLPNVFDLGKVFVISSYHEGFATTLLEAHARGLPAIVTKSSGFCGEFVEGYGEKTGIVFIPQDIEKKGFLQEIENLINNYLIYEKKSINKAKIFSQDKVLGPIRNVL